VYLWRPLSFALVLFACSGCGKNLVDLKVRVTLDGRPLEGASVTLHPASTNKVGRTSSGVTSAGGTVRFTTFHPFDGVPRGKFKVVVLKSPTSVNEEFANADRSDPQVLMRLEQREKIGNVPYSPTILPRIYLNPQQTPLECTVPSDEDEVVFDIKSSMGSSNK
jgi:hypothetical protein